MAELLDSHMTEPGMAELGGAVGISGPRGGSFMPPMLL